MVLYVHSIGLIAFLKLISSIAIIVSIALIAYGIHMVLVDNGITVLILGLVLFPISLITGISTTRMRFKKEEDI